ncbi:DUF6882 domain-containing protein [Wielerella bovis]|uniref:DUF6882 domain-containing protein n=1 Tax=Wielerella bovis TaxID=2917790 RepID=UPI0020194D81|nr:DUF6882 domain-containing protein [Wielerella bovis]ULJ64649.1 hypothetical protein MIS33_11080 [Wielerella bovis]ULJ66921.1 hypothetical protein MIS31_11970 [Wielerella bovis]
MKKIILTLLLTAMCHVHALPIPNKLLESHVGIAADKQWTLLEKIGNEPEWQVNLNTGKIQFNQQEFDAQVIGSYAQSDRSWLWAWANVQSGLPESVLRDSQKLRDYGKRHQIKWLTQAKHRPYQEQNIHELASIAVGITGADGYYLARTDNMIVVLTVRHTEQPAQTNLQQQHLHIITTIPKMIGSFSLNNHQRVIEHYLHQKGYQTQMRQSILTARKDTHCLKAQFDKQKRLAELLGQCDD